MRPFVIIEDAQLKFHLPLADANVKFRQDARATAKGLQSIFSSKVSGSIDQYVDCFD